MTDARMEWISKRAYSLWEEAGRPHGQDVEHWAQAEREREDFERVALAPEARSTGTRTPLIEISRKAQAKKKADAGAEKPVAAKTVAKVKSSKAANTKPI